MKTTNLTRIALYGAILWSLQVQAQDNRTSPAGLDASTTVTPVAAQPAAPPFAAYRDLDLYGSAQHLTNGYGNWSEVGARGNYGIGNNLLHGEIATMRRFRQSGNYLGLGDTYVFNPDWFGSVFVGAGDGASYLPRYRVDAFINRKLLDARNLIGTLGAGYYRAPDGHTDRHVSLGGAYYFSVPLVVQAEARYNESSPGKVRTSQQFVAATIGREKQTKLIARYGWGGEGYQSIGQGTVLQNFHSEQGSLMLRHWFAPKWGAMVSVEHYTNPFYKRDGATIGLFFQMP